MAPLETADCYVPLLHKAHGLVEHCRQLVERNDLLWMPHFGFLALRLSRSLISNEPALQTVNQITPIAQLGILQMPDHWVYHWHRDHQRQACINLLINDNHHSHTLFGERVSSTSMHCLELCYKPSHFYLFNNQVPHTVINLDRNRYLFSLEFAGNHSYSELRDRFAAAKLLA